METIDRFRVFLSEVIASAYAHEVCPPLRYPSEPGDPNDAMGVEWRIPRKSNEINGSYRYLSLIIWSPDATHVGVWSQYRWNVIQKEDVLINESTGDIDFRPGKSRIEGESAWQMVGYVEKSFRLSSELLTQDLSEPISRFLERHQDELQFFSPMLKRWYVQFQPTEGLQQKLRQANLIA